MREPASTSRWAGAICGARSPARCAVKVLAPLLAGPRINRVPCRRRRAVLPVSSREQPRTAGSFLPSHFFQRLQSQLTGSGQSDALLPPSSESGLVSVLLVRERSAKARARGAAQEVKEGGP